jgi:hypothetical protein
MTLVKITDKLFMTFNEEFTNTKELIKDIPDDCRLLFDIETFRIKIYANKEYEDNNLILKELNSYESKLFKSIYRLNSKKELEINGEKYTIKNIIHSKIFSHHKPHIPIIHVEKTINSNGVIMYKDKILGVKNDSMHIVPLYFLINICINFIKNSAFFFLIDELNYNVCEVIDDTKKIDYYLVIKKKFKIKNITSAVYIFNPLDIIYSINNVHFNFNGHLYSDKYRMYFTLNTFILLHDIKELNIEYTPNKNIYHNNDTDNLTTLKVKTIKIMLDRFDETKLKIPNINSMSIKYNSLTFNLLTEKIYNKLQDRIKIQLNNQYSTDKIIITELDAILYKVVRISNKNINNINDVDKMLYKKNVLMSKRTIILKNLENGETKKIIL